MRFASLSSSIKINGKGLPEKAEMKLVHTGDDFQIELIVAADGDENPKELLPCRTHLLRRNMRA